MRRIIQTVHPYFLLFLAFSLSGCPGTNPSFFSDVDGTKAWVGSLTVSDHLGTEAHDVTARVQKIGKTMTLSQFLLQLYNDSNLLIFSIDSKISKRSVELQSVLFNASKTTILEWEGACAKSSKNESGEFEICLTDQSFQLQAVENDSERRVFLYLSLVDKSELKSNEEDQAIKDYLLSELVEQVKTTNYDTRLKAEKLFQARAEIDLARGKLFPHFNGGTVIKALMAASSASMATMMGVPTSPPYALVGDLIPFIFPSRWYEVKVAKQYYWADKYSYSALVANQIQLVESLYYSISRDQAISAELKNYVTTLEDLEQRVRAGQGASGLSPRKILKFKNRVLSLADDVLTIENLLVSEYSALSRSLGLSVNIAGLISASEPRPDLNSLNSNHEFKLSAMLPKVLVRAPEIKQIAQLLIAAEASKKVRAYSFLDPGANPKHSLGFGYAATISIGKSNERELQILLEKTEARVKEQLTNIISELNTLSERSGILNDLSKNAEVAFQLALSELDTTGNFSDLDALLNDLDLLLKYRLLLIQLKAAWSVTKSKLDRIMLSGHYE